MNDYHGSASSELWSLLAARCDGAMTPQSWERLNQLLRNDPDARRIYILHMDQHAALLWRYRDGVAEEGYPSGPVTVSVVPAGPTIPTFSAGLWHGAINCLSSGWPLAYLIATVVLATGLLVAHRTPRFAAVPFASHTPAVSDRSLPEREVQLVGQVTGAVDCRWVKNGDSPAVGASVPVGYKCRLASGLLEITYSSGAKVLLQGPVTYTVESPAGGYLSVGKLTARLDGNAKRGTLNAKLPGSSSSFSIQPSAFVVRTPTAMVTDLGTEFGVEVAKSGETTSHVFRGSVRVQRTSADGMVQSDGQEVGENQTVRVEASPGKGQIITLRTFAPSTFVREIPRVTGRAAIRMFDLVDVVAGGDGFSGRRNRGIDPRNGRIVTNPFDVGNVVGDSRYRRVEELPFVDGVFVPNGAGGPVRTDSAGHACDCFLTGVNETSGPVWAGGVIPTTTTSPISAELNGVDYSKPGHGLLSMHANKAVTFDLNAIRRANPDYTLLRFEAVTGGTGGAGGLAGLVDMRVIVDGQARFQRRQVSREHGAFVVSVPIARNDHFLTLAVTDGGDGIGGDGVIFGDPRLQMLSDTAGQPSTTIRARKGGATDKHQ
jgi:hypothetical protein